MFVFELMRSKFWIGVAGASLLVAVGLTVFLVRSYSYYDAVYYSNLVRTHQLFTVPGSLVFCTWDHLPGDAFDTEFASGPVGQTPMPAYRDGHEVKLTEWDHPPGMKLGFWFEHGSVPLYRADGRLLFTQTHYNIALPIVLLVIAFLLPPVGWGLKLLQRYRRAKSGRCIFCNAVMNDPEQCTNCGAEFDRLIV